MLTIEKIQKKTFDTPDEVREFPNGHLELVKIGDTIVGRATLEPGWKWSKDVQPIAQTDSCQSAHFLYQIAGMLHTVMDDGTEIETRAGEVFLIPPGHDAWVVGEEPVVLIDFQGFAEYAKK